MIKLYSVVNGVRQDLTSSLLEMPAGEWHIKHPGLISKGFCNNEIAVITGCNHRDYIALLIWADAVKRDGGTPYLIIPYLPGARQDRRNTGEALSAKVYADLINSCGFKKVICIDPHSDVMPALINNVRVVDIFKPFGLVVQYFDAFKPIERFKGIIAPDAGANKRASKLATAMHLPVYQALKKRDTKTGKLTDFKCERLPKTGKLLVVDDICDGGGTFKGLATATKLPPDRLALWVTHGVFSEKSEDLWKYYSKIFTTDSYCRLPLYEDKLNKITSCLCLNDYLLNLMKEFMS